MRCLNSHCDEKREVVVEEEDRSADLGASSGSRGRPPANMASTLRISIAEGQKIESQMCFKRDSLILGPPCIYIYRFYFVIVVDICMTTILMESLV